MNDRKERASAFGRELAALMAKHEVRYIAPTYDDEVEICFKEPFDGFSCIIHPCLTIDNSSTIGEHLRNQDEFKAKESVDTES